MIYFILLVYAMYLAIYFVLLSEFIKIYKDSNNNKSIEPPSKADVCVFIKSADNFIKEINDYPSRQ